MLTILDKSGVPLNYTNELAVESLSMYPDAGESEAIVLAKEKDCLLIIDDRDGRKTTSGVLVLRLLKYNFYEMQCSKVISPVRCYFN